jgi:hypothetical protein
VPFGANANNPDFLDVTAYIYPAAGSLTGLTLRGTFESISMQPANQSSVRVPAFNVLPCLDICSQVLVDGYVAHCFTPRHAERYFLWLLKGIPIPSYPASQVPGSESAFFFVTSVPRHIPSQFPGHPRWVLDRRMVYKGTVVPQTLWAPHTITDKRHHVEEAELQLPIFFEYTDGRLGLPLEAAAAGRCHGLKDSQNFAPLGMKSTTHIRIVVSGIFRAVVMSPSTELVHLLVARLPRFQAPGSDS